MDNRNSRAAGYPGMDADELARLQRLTGGPFVPGTAGTPNGSAMNTGPAYGMPGNEPAAPAFAGGQSGVSPSTIMSGMPPASTAGMGSMGTVPNSGTGSAESGAANAAMNPAAGMPPMSNMFPMGGMSAQQPAASAAQSSSNGQSAGNRASDSMGSASPSTGTAAAESPATDAEMQDFMEQGYLMGPNCFGRDARMYAERMMEYINDEYKDHLTYLALARRAPSAQARTILRNIAADEMRHARRWAAAYFLITGKRYFPERGSMEAAPIASYSQALRERYLAESQGAVQYRRFARETNDRCLRRLATEASNDERQHAQHILELIQRQYR